ncbi:hypothetical protein B5M06_13190 [Comamonas kerstersii]|uniref:Uncharacterized protein n=1 Tax=Comamonas kerstersii TaxID=225992 RepID=A0A1V0BGJ9_9BURK|nr:hypothetical protein [Comamonas kerstersii]AQZ99063.1 hypothetical protein B5M06_13190 [Comamonas kerstersii]
MAQKFMQSALKFSKASTSTLLKSVDSQSKLFEMLVLDDEQIDELALTGEPVHSLSLSPTTMTRWNLPIWRI